MKKMLSLFAALVMALTAVCLPALAEAPKPILVGAIAPITGPVPAYGASVTNGIKQAVAEINAAGGVLGRPLEVTYMDDKADSTEGANAFNKLVSDGVCAVIGSVTSGVTLGLSTLATEKNMLLLTPTATNVSITGVEKPSVFRTCYLDSFQGAMAARLMKELGLTKAAVLYAASDPYSAGLRDAFVETAKALGLEIVAEESSSSITDVDYTSQLTNIAFTQPEAIFAAYYYDVIGPYVVPQARAAGYTGYFIGADGWDGTTGTMLEDKSLYNNCFFVNHYAQDDPSEIVQGFVTNYIATYGEEALNALAALAYDSVYMLKQAIETAGTDTTADIVKAMTGMSFVGVTGNFKLSETGTPDKSITAIQLVDGKAVMYGQMEEGKETVLAGASN